jgi:type III secretory pathway component EscT
MGISAMNSIISNNRKLLKNGKRVPFTKMDGRSSKKQGYKLYVMPCVFPHVLRRVRIKVKRENKRLFLKKIIIGTIVGLAMLYWFYGIQFG